MIRTYPESEVRDLEHPSTVYEAVGRLQVGVELERGVMEEDHASHDVPHQGGQEHVIQLHVIVVQNVPVF